MRAGQKSWVSSISTLLKYCTELSILQEHRFITLASTEADPEHRMIIVEGIFHLELLRCLLIDTYSIKFF